MTGTSATTTKTPPAIRWQLPMQRVLYALAPLVAASVYFYGWRVVWLLAVCNLAGFLTERVFTRYWKEPVTSAVFVSATLLVMSLPPALPSWMAALGTVFGVAFGKMVFGGFGKNVFNPALTGRAFVYVSFGNHMTGRWNDAYSGFPGGFAAFGPLATPDAVTSATPGMLMKQGQCVPWMDLFLGNSAGVIGGTSAVLTLICGIWLVWTKAASYRIVIGGFTGYLVTQTVIWMLGLPQGVNPLYAIMAGGALIGIFFYATDPVSASQTDEGRWIYGAFVGILSSLISNFSAWPAGTMFAILLANMFAPLLDYSIKQRKKKGVPVKVAPAGGGA